MWGIGRKGVGKRDHWTCERCHSVAGMAGICWFE